MKLSGNRAYEIKMQSMLSQTALGKLSKMEFSPPAAWCRTGANSRPNLHGLLRYPAMMVPCMQGDIIDVLLSSIGKKCQVFDPFVGSGTIMTEALVRGLDFTGVDINPLAALVCEAKAIIDEGIDISESEVFVLNYIDNDPLREIDIEFPGREKWFNEQSTINFSSIRRAIRLVEDIKIRKILWTVFSETIRLCSNSRTSTYKLHIRKPDDFINPDKVFEIFKLNLRKTSERINEYKEIISHRDRENISLKIICNDIRKVDFEWPASDHQFLVTSPPYGDNQTTIPYGQFSYLAMQWISDEDLPGSISKEQIFNAGTIDAASLGGTIKGAAEKEALVREFSPTFNLFMEKVKEYDKQQIMRKVVTFIADFAEAMEHIHKSTNSSAHWVITTGNRTVGGLTVPFDAICKDLFEKLGGKQIATLHRPVYGRRMPARNSHGALITTENTSIIEFF